MTGWHWHDRTRRTETVARPLFPRYGFGARDLGCDDSRGLASPCGVGHRRNLTDYSGDPDGVGANLGLDDRRLCGVLGLPAGAGPGPCTHSVLEQLADRVAI